MWSIYLAVGVYRTGLHHIYLEYSILQTFKGQLKLLLKFESTCISIQLTTIFIHKSLLTVHFWFCLNCLLNATKCSHSEKNCILSTAILSTLTFFFEESKHFLFRFLFCDNHGCKIRTRGHPFRIDIQAVLSRKWTPPTKWTCRMS